MATEVKLRSERKAGQFLAEMKEQGQIVAHRPKEVGHDVPVKLSEIGIKPQESRRWQRIASIPEERFEEYLLSAEKRTQASLLITAAKYYVLEPEPFRPNKGNVESQVFHLNVLGWTQEEIAEALGVTQQAVSLKLQDLQNFVKLVKSLLERGDSIADVAG